MPTYFPDTTVLINFGLINRITLLGTLIRNPTWCATVASECSDQFKRHGIPHYAQVAGIFGNPLIPTLRESVDTKNLRRTLASPGDEKTKHLGEAETIAIATSPERTYAPPVLFITDDGSATKAAQKDGLVVVDTWRLIRAAHKQGSLSQNDVWNDLCILRTNKRGWPMGIGHTSTAVNNWLT